MPFFHRRALRDLAAWMLSDMPWQQRCACRILATRPEPEARAIVWC